MYYVGIDVAKHTHTAAIKLDDGTSKGDVLEFTNDAKGFNSLLNFFEKFGVSPDESLIVMESTGHYWKVLYSYLLDNNFSVAVENPLRIDAYRNAGSIRKTKTDAIDAVLIADFARVKTPNPTNLAPDAMANLKELSRYRASLVKRRTATKNEATAICDRLFPELANVIGTINCKAARAVMREFTTPKIVATTDIRTLTKTLKNASHGRFGNKNARALKDAAKNSVGTKAESDAAAFVLKGMMNELDNYDAEIAKIEDKIAEVMEGTSAEYLLTIPGVSEISASAIAGEIGNPWNFENSSKLIAFAGIDPSKSESGQFASSRNHMSKRGSAHLRCALMTAANTARCHDPYFGDYYDSLRTRGKHHFVALSGVARKLAGVALAVMKEQRNYERKPSIQSLGQTWKVAI